MTMKSEKAVLVVRDCLGVAAQINDRIAVRAEAGVKLDRNDTTFLVRVLRSALCAAQELDQRAMGQPEPKRGD